MYASTSCPRQAESSCSNGVPPASCFPEWSQNSRARNAAKECQCAFPLAPPKQTASPAVRCLVALVAEEAFRAIQPSPEVILNAKQFMSGSSQKQQCGSHGRVDRGIRSLATSVVTGPSNAAVVVHRAMWQSRAVRVVHVKLHSWAVDEEGHFPRCPSRRRGGTAACKL